MKYLNLAFRFSIIALLVTSCYHDDIIDTQAVQTTLFNQDLWYVDIHTTEGNGEVPFIQRAFTLSFLSEGLYANNNIVGIGNTGNGYGIQIADYAIDGNLLTVSHADEGTWNLEIYPINNKKIELYHRGTDTSFYLIGYQKHNFDYDLVFYDNLHYLLQEYAVWEKVSTSATGAVNDFDKEQLLQFFPENNGTFRSSIDLLRIGLNRVEWDYAGLYKVYDIPNEKYLKTLTLDYDYLGNDYFEIDVINDKEIDLYHPTSKTTYTFVGRSLQLYAKAAKNLRLGKKRQKNVNAVMNVKKARQIK